MPNSNNHHRLPRRQLRPAPQHRLARDLEVELYQLQFSILRSERALAMLRTSPQFNAVQIRVRTAALVVERRHLEETAVALGRAMDREERFLVWWNALTAVSLNTPSISTFSKYIYNCSVGRAASAPTRSRDARNQEGSGSVGKRQAVEGGRRRMTIMEWRESGHVGGFALIVVIDETDTIARLVVNQHACTVISANTPEAKSIN